MTTRKLYRLAGLALFLCIYAALAYASKTTLTGPITDSFGTGINGTLIMRLPVPAQDTTSNTAVSNIPVTFQLVNGAIKGGAQLYDVVNLQPQNLFYIARAYDTSGNLVFAGNYAVTGGSFNLGAATPTSVTTSNISYLNPASLTANNTWTGTNAFTSLNSVAPGVAAATDNWQWQDVYGVGPNPPSTLTLTHTGTSSGLASVSLPNMSLGGDAVFTASPRLTWAAFINGNITTNNYSLLIPDKAITITRMDAVAQTTAAGCASPPHVQVSDGTTTIFVPLANGTTINDTGPFTQNYAAGANLIMTGTTGSGCVTPPQNIGVVVEYRMQ